MPDYVDRIVVVDDDSQDGTAETVRRYLPDQGERLLLIRHETNQGVGGAIATGYRWRRVASLIMEMAARSWYNRRGRSDGG